MVQLPATAAIEYVAAPGGLYPRGSFARGHFWPGDFCPWGFLSGGGAFVRGAYARSPQFQCVYAPSRLSVPSIVA